MNDPMAKTRRSEIPLLTWSDVLATIFFAATVVLIIAWLGRIGIDSLPPEVSGLVRDGWAWLASAAGGLIVALLFKRAITVWHVMATVVLSILMCIAVVYLNSVRINQLSNEGDAAVSNLQQRIAETRIEFFHTGEGTKSSAGAHYGCYKDNQAPALACGKSSTPIAVDRYRVHSGDKCGYHYYAVACMPNR